MIWQLDLVFMLREESVHFVLVLRRTFDVLEEPAPSVNIQRQVLGRTREFRKCLKSPGWCWNGAWSISLIDSREQGMNTSAGMITASHPLTHHSHSHHSHTAIHIHFHCLGDTNTLRLHTPATQAWEPYNCSVHARCECGTLCNNPPLALRVNLWNQTQRLFRREIQQHPILYCATIFNNLHHNINCSTA